MTERASRAGWRLGLLAALAAPLALAVQPGQAVGPVQGQDEAGKQQSLEAQRGKVVVLVFWGSQCPSSKRYAQRLADLARRWGDKVVVLGVASNGYEDAGKVQAAKREQGLPFPVILDPGGAIAKRLQVGSTPIALVVDGQGTLRYRGQLDDDPNGQKGDKAEAWARDAVQALVDGKAPGKSSSDERGTKINP